MKTNQSNRLKNTISYFMSIVFILSLASCNNQSTVIQPANVDSDFMQLYNQVKSRAGSSEAVGWDLQIHQYTFSVSYAKTITKIGYKGDAVLFSTNKPYTIEIVNQAGIVIYTGSHLFQSNAMDYQSITPTTILPNQSYIIRRIAVGYPNLTTVYSTVVGGPTYPFAFPVSLNGLTITDGGFRSNQQLIRNGIPQIDIVFQ
jgi:signal peptidase I